MPVRRRNREERYECLGEGESLLSACVRYVTEWWQLGKFLKNWLNPWMFLCFWTMVSHTIKCFMLSCFALLWSVMLLIFEAMDRSKTWGGISSHLLGENLVKCIHFSRHPCVTLQGCGKRTSLILLSAAGKQLFCVRNKGIEASVRRW